MSGILRRFFAALRLRLVFAVLGLAAAFACITSMVHAAITGTGDVSPTNPASWTYSTYGFIGKNLIGTITVDDGSQLLSKYGYIGSISGSAGTVTVMGTGSKWSNGYGISIGWGALHIIAGGQVTAEYCEVGYSPGSFGTLTIQGAGSSLSQYYDLLIGGGGTGTFQLEAGGQTVCRGGYLGYSVGSTGTATITGMDSKWTSNYALRVGFKGDGKLNIEGGGEVINPEGDIGFYAGSTGEVSVVGIGSKWTNSGDLYVGYDGSGKLTIKDGGMVTVNQALYASLSDLSGNGNVSTCGAVLDGDLTFDSSHGQQAILSFGTGGTLSVNQNAVAALGAGYKSNGAVRIADGVQVASSASILGDHSGASGTATVTGTGSKWTNNGLCRIGVNGSGTLNIESGGCVENTNFSNVNYLGYNMGSSGIVTITGANSKWSNNAALCIGNYGNGTLNIGTGIGNGGLVIVKGISLAKESDSHGMCNINGGTLRAVSIARGAGLADFVWNDGTIQNYNSTSDLTINSTNNLVLKLSATGIHSFDIDFGRIGKVNAVLADATSGGTLNKIGPGTLTLTAVNTYSGNTTVEAGRFNVTGSILNTSGIDVAAGATLELAKTSGSATSATLYIDNAGTVLISAGFQKVGAINGTGMTQVVGSATLTAQSIVQNSLTIGGTGALSMNAVPEPSTLLLLSLAALGLVIRRLKSK